MRQLRLIIWTLALAGCDGADGAGWREAEVASPGSDADVPAALAPDSELSVLPYPDADIPDDKGVTIREQVRVGQAILTLLRLREDARIGDKYDDVIRWLSLVRCGADDTKGMERLKDIPIERIYCLSDLNLAIGVSCGEIHYRDGRQCQGAALGP